MRVDGLGGAGDFSFKDAAGETVGGAAGVHADGDLPAGILGDVGEDADGVDLGDVVKGRGVGGAAGGDEVADVDAALGDDAVDG